MLGQLHIGRVITQAGKGLLAQAVPVGGLAGGRSGKQGMPGATIQKHALAEQRVISQRVRTAVTGNDADLKLPVQHATLNGIERRHMQMQAHIRCL